MKLNDTDCWAHVLQDFVNNYNNTYHRAIKMKPIEMQYNCQLEREYIKQKFLKFMETKRLFDHIKKGVIVRRIGFVTICTRLF